MWNRLRPADGDDVRGADFSGSWYPERKASLLKKIAEFEEEARAPTVLSGGLVGGIVPHAGWVYSGKLACNVIKVLSENSKPDTVVVFGTHMRPSSRPTILSKGAWWTPLGNVPVDEVLVEGLTSKFDLLEESPQHYEADNTIELQMPLIKHYFPNVKVVTIGAPPTGSSFEIGKELVGLAKASGRRIVVIGSTDLTHYGPNYGLIPEGVGEKAVRWVKDHNDRKVMERMVAMEPDKVMEQGLDNKNACCMGAAATAIYVGKLLGASKGEVLNYYTSYDVDPNTSFVGYVALVF